MSDLNIFYKKEIRETCAVVTKEKAFIIFYFHAINLSTYPIACEQVQHILVFLHSNTTGGNELLYLLNLIGLRCYY